MTHEKVGLETTVDDAFEALADSRRRELLFGLHSVDPPADGMVDPRELLGRECEVSDLDATQVELHHVHLPKLSEKGYLDWKRDAGEISKGPAWDEISPLLDVLRENESVLPGGFP